MKIFILILWIHTGMMSDKDSMAITSVPNFASAEQCRAAGEAAIKMPNGTVKAGKYVCVEGWK